MSTCNMNLRGGWMKMNTKGNFASRGIGKLESRAVLENRKIHQQQANQDGDLKAEVTYIPYKFK